MLSLLYNLLTVIFSRMDKIMLTNPLSRERSSSRSTYAIVYTALFFVIWLFVASDVASEFNFYVFTVINSLARQSIANIVIQYVSALGNWILWLAVAMILMIARRSPRMPLAWFILISITMSAICVNAVRIVYPSDRPFLVNELSAIVVGTKPNESGFPSGHSTTVFAAIGTVYRFLRRYRTYIFAIPFAVAFSRIYMGVHFPTDVMAGAFLGMAVSELVMVIRSDLVHRNIAFTDATEELT